MDHPPDRSPQLDYARRTTGTRLSGEAVAAFVLGLLSLPLAWLFFPAALAIFIGISAAHEIKFGEKNLYGRPLALAGAILGMVSIGIIFLGPIVLTIMDWTFFSLR